MSDTDDNEDVPQFIQPKNVLQLSNEELEREIAARQQRRLAAFQIYAATLQRSKEVRDEKLRTQLTKQLAGFEKEIAAIDKALQKARDRVNKIRGIRLELDDAFDITKREEI